MMDKGDDAVRSNKQILRIKGGAVAVAVAVAFSQ